MNKIALPGLTKPKRQPGCLFSHFFFPPDWGLYLLSRLIPSVQPSPGVVVASGISACPSTQP